MDGEILRLKFVAEDFVTQISQKVGASIEALTGKLGHAAEEHGALWGKIGTVAAVGLAATAGAALAVGGALMATIPPAAEFQAQMTKLVGTAGESADNLKLVSNGILAMAGQVGYSAGQLADGMYLIESAGFHGAAGLDVLRASAMAAKAENADFPTVADAVTSALNAYALGADKATAVTDLLLTATAQGKMTFQDLTGSLSQVLPIAATAHIQLGEVAAALATMTMQGRPAAQAATDLQYLIKGLEVPSKIAQAEFKKLGLDVHEFADELQARGLKATLDDLTDAIAKKFPRGSAEYNEAVSRIIGNVEGLNAALMLSGDHAKTFQSNLEGMSGSTGKTKSAFDDMISTVSGRWSQVTAAFQAFTIQLGTKLLPIAEQVLGWVANVGMPAVQNASVVLVNWFVANWPAIGRAIQQVWDLLQQGWNEVAPILKAELPAAVSAVTSLFGFLRQHGELVRDIFLLVGAAGAVVVGAIIGIGVVVVGAIAALVWLYDRFNDVWRIVNNVSDAIAHFIGMVGQAVGAVRSVPVLGGALAALGIPGLAGGGIVTRPTLAVVGESGPEMIVPLSAINQGSQAASIVPALSPSASSDDGWDMLSRLDRLIELQTVIAQALTQRSSSNRFANAAYRPV